MTRSVESMLLDIEQPNQQSAQDLWHDLKTYLPNAAGSTGAHQAWPGGYYGHIKEVMNFAYELYDMLEAKRQLPFNLQSALLVLFLHDSEKPFKRADDNALKFFEWIKERPTKSDKEFQKKLLSQYAFSLTEDEINGLMYVEGEGDDYVHGERVQGPLAAFCHTCDVVSARIWHDHPRGQDED